MKVLKLVMFGAAVTALALSTGATVRAQGKDCLLYTSDAADE